MFEDELLRMRECSDDEQGKSLNRLVDQFRAGRNIEEMYPLLLSDDDALVEVGAYITSEIETDYYNTPKMIKRLAQLTNHRSAIVRFYALSSLFPVLDPSNKETQMMIARLCNDENEGVKRAAARASRSLGIDN